MDRCDYCGKSTDGLSHKCKFCGQSHCSEHLLPESHKCRGLKNYREGNAERWKKAVIDYKKSVSKKEEHPFKPIFLLKGNKTNQKEDSSKPKFPSKKNKIKKKVHTLLIKFIGILVVLLIISYICYNNSEAIQNLFKKNNSLPHSQKINVDEFSQASFDYINSYRAERGINALTFADELYPVLVSIVKQKELNASLFKLPLDSLDYIKKNLQIEGVSFSYIKIFYLGGKGIEEFKKQFNQSPAVRTLISDSKYRVGAVGCSLDYCAVVVYDNLEVRKNSSEIKSSLFDEEETNQEKESFKLGSPLKPKIDMLGLEKEIHDLINQQRQENGRSSLIFDEKLATIARLHSQDMAKNNFFEHENLQGQDPTDRANAQKYRCYKDFGSYFMEGIAENIFQNNLYDSITYINGIPIHEWNVQSEIATSTVEGWMDSPGHRENILTSTYDKEGIGIAISDDDKVYITQDFC